MAQIAGRLIADLFPDGVVRTVFIVSVSGLDTGEILPHTQNQSLNYD